MGDRRGGLLGLLVGDALGVPYEFHAPEDLPQRLTMEPPVGFRRAHVGTPPGTWSDDGAQALCLLASLTERGCLDLEDFARRLQNWRNVGYMAVDHRVFDIGNQTALALDRLGMGVAPEAAGGAGEWDNGNGSLMRVLPLALWHSGSDAELVRDAELQSLPTHAHPRSQVCCALYCLWARALLGGASLEAGWSDAVARLDALYTARPAFRQELQQQVLPARSPAGSGYVVDTLWGVRESLLGTDSFEAAVLAAIKLGNDTDTTACIAGGLAGIVYGEAAIPPEWLSALRGRVLVDPLLDALG